MQSKLDTPLYCCGLISTLGLRLTHSNRGMGPILSVSVLNANHSACHREYGLLVDVKPPDESTKVGIGDRFKEPIW